VVRPEVVVIGGSAGGMRAVRGILEALGDIRTSVMCVVLHRSPEHSPLLEVLGSYTAIPVHEPDDSPWDCPPGSLIVAPAGYHLLIGRRRTLAAEPPTPVTPYETVQGVRAHLTLDPPVVYSRPSLDVAFVSAADFTESVIAVLLSCANDDGAAGCEAIKAAGGRVVLQDPATCEAPIAVNAALRRVEPDYVADPTGIGRWLSHELR
jgi:two-component system, chemotaxis family, protein-glutamate methylesterase/glutaminase